MTTSLVVTVVGPDLPGIVNQLSEVAQRLGADWAASRMPNLAGQFAGMVHFEVPDDRADALAKALGALDSPGVNAALRRHIDPAKMTVVVAGDAAKGAK